MLLLPICIGQRRIFDNIDFSQRPNLWTLRLKELAEFIDLVFGTIDREVKILKDAIDFPEIVIEAEWEIFLDAGLLFQVPANIVSEGRGTSAQKINSNA